VDQLRTKTSVPRALKGKRRVGETWSWSTIGLVWWVQSEVNCLWATKSKIKGVIETIGSGSHEND